MPLSTRAKPERFQRPAGIDREMGSQRGDCQCWRDPVGFVNEARPASPRPCLADRLPHHLGRLPVENQQRAPRARRVVPVARTDLYRVVFHLSARYASAADSVDHPVRLQGGIAALWATGSDSVQAPASVVLSPCWYYGAHESFWSATISCAEGMAMAELVVGALPPFQARMMTASTWPLV